VIDADGLVVRERSHEVAAELARGADDESSHTTYVIVLADVLLP
jgi:hypothetical protein